VLEIGAGSGYAAAILSQIANQVFTVERHPELAQAANAAKARLKRLGYHNVQVLSADGTRGWPDKAPCDAIVVAAGGPRIPSALLQQLRIGDRLEEFEHAQFNYLYLQDAVWLAHRTLELTPA